MQKTVSKKQIIVGSETWIVPETTDKNWQVVSETATEFVIEILEQP